jgi:hypothetical protein
MAHQVKVLVVPVDLGLPGIAKITTVNTTLTLSDDQFAQLSPNAFTGGSPILQDLGYVGAGAVSVQAAKVTLTSAQDAALTTTQTAGTTYVSGTTDVMINNLKADLTALRTQYNALQVDVAAIITALTVSGGPMKAS